jgi:hypothetical protein
MGHPFVMHKERCCLDTQTTFESNLSPDFFCSIYTHWMVDWQSIWRVIDLLFIVYGPR